MSSCVDTPADPRYSLFGRTALGKQEHVGWDLIFNEPNIFTKIVGVHIVESIKQGVFGSGSSLRSAPKHRIVFLVPGSNELRAVVHLLGTKQHLKHQDSVYFQCYIRDATSASTDLIFPGADLNVHVSTCGYDTVKKCMSGGELQYVERMILQSISFNDPMYLIAPIGQDFFCSLTEVRGIENGAGNVSAKNVLITPNLDVVLKSLGLL